MTPPDVAMFIFGGVLFIIIFLLIFVKPFVNPKKRNKDLDFAKIFLEGEQKKLDTQIATEKAIKREKLRKRQKKIKAEAEELKSNQKELF